MRMRNINSNLLLEEAWYSDVALNPETQGVKRVEVRAVAHLKRKTRKILKKISSQLSAVAAHPKMVLLKEN